MRKAEQKLWDAMRSNIPAGWWVQRVENVVTDGMPDVFVASPRGTQTWVELKAPKPRARRTTPLLSASEGLRVSQVNWHLKAALRQIRTYVLVRVSGKLYLLPGDKAEEINEWNTEACERWSCASTWQELWEELI